MRPLGLCNDSCFFVNRVPSDGTFFCKWLSIRLANQIFFLREDAEDGLPRRRGERREGAERGRRVKLIKNNMKK